MNIVLKSLNIKNFKGISSLEISLRNGTNSIYGDNATGKTSVYDAFYWLLFDVDSHDSKKFDIKPLDGDGNVADPGTVTEVEAVLNVDGDDLSLKKTYYEKWSQKRGSANKTFDGNTSDYFIDDVPVKKTVYEAKISELVDRETFRMLTNINYFASIMKWDKRREILMQLCGLPSDDEIMALDPKFELLPTMLKGASIDDAKKRIIAQRKKLNEQKSNIPIKIETLNERNRELMQIDFNKIAADLADAQNIEVLALESLAKVKAGTEIAELKSNAANIKAELEAYEKANEQYRANQNTEKSSEDVEHIKQMLAAAQVEQCDVKRKLIIAEQKVAALRDKWKQINNMKFSKSEICPMCGQPFPKDNIEKAKAEFEAEKAKKLDECKTDGEDAAKRVKSFAEDIDVLSKKIAALETSILNAESDPKTEILDMPGYLDTRTEFERNLKDACQKVAEATANQAERVERANARVSAARARVAELMNESLKKEYLEGNKTEIERLREEAKSIAGMIEELDRAVFLMEDYVRFKVGFITDAVNEKFALAKFKLFNEQVNSGLSECCDVVYEGASFETNLNSGMRINVGIDIISTLSAACGVSVPLFIDNAESVTALNLVDNMQVIRLVVSANDKELRVE